MHNTINTIADQVVDMHDKSSDSQLPLIAYALRLIHIPYLGLIATLHTQLILTSQLGQILTHPSMVYLYPVLLADGHALLSMTPQHPHASVTTDSDQLAVHSPCWARSRLVCEVLIEFWTFGNFLVCSCSEVLQC